MSFLLEVPAWSKNLVMALVFVIFALLNLRKVLRTADTWREAIEIVNGKGLPLIATWGIFGILFYNLGHYWGADTQEYLQHSGMSHWTANHLVMAIFLAFMGLEISIEELKKAGICITFMILGGMFVPLGVTYALTGMLYLALPSVATDVAFSIGASNLVTRKYGESMKKVLALMATTLATVAIGDDAAGVMIATGTFVDPSKIEIMALLAAIYMLYRAYMNGTHGVEYFRGRVARIDEEITDATPIVHGFRDIIEEDPRKWFVHGSIVALLLAIGKAEWIVGHCLVFIVAPPVVKHYFEHLMQPFIPFLLGWFGFVNCGIRIDMDLLTHPITWLCCAGGAGGKMLGFFGGGVLGRWVTRRRMNKKRLTDPDAQNVYEHMPLRQLYAGLAVPGSANGAIAIFFVAMGKSKGYLTDEQAAYATFGFFMTVPLAYIHCWIIGATGWVEPDPLFQAEPDPHDGDFDVAAAAHVHTT